MLAGYDAKTPEKWVDVPNGEVANYVTLVGIPISGVPVSSTENL